MRYRLSPPVLLLLGLSACGGSGDAPDAGQSEPESVPDSPALLQYPETPKVEVVDNYHGIEVADPYRWLEEDVRESQDVAEWVAAQNQVTAAYLESLPRRDAFRERLTALWNYERYSVPFAEGGRVFYYRNDGLQNQDVLYVQDGVDAEPRVLIDPSTWSDDGTIALGDAVPSPDGRYLAYAVQDGGSDWRTWRVMRIDSGRVLEEELNWLKFTSVSWAADSSGFYYSRYPAPDENEAMQSLNLNQAVYFHRLNTVQAEDQRIFATPEHPEWGHLAEVTEDGRHLVVTTFVGTDNRYRITVCDLRTQAVIPLIGHFEHDYTFIAKRGRELFFLTNDGAPLYRVIAIDLDQPRPGHWREIVAEDGHVLSSVGFVGGRLFAEYLQDARSAVRMFDLEGNDLGSLELPGIGNATGFTGRSGDATTYYSFSSFNTPPVIHRYDIASGRRQLFRRAEVDFDPDDYVVEQVFYISRDGTRVPMFIARHTKLKNNGRLPVLLYGYGGFNIALTPAFSVRWLAWMEMGGVVAVANLRGGGEYGREWHQAGTKLNKQNVFDDFIAAAEYLIAENYTGRDRLAIMGGSNGGLLVGAVLNQRPELFEAALPMVGVMDMLRFHLFTAGRFWVDDYGSAENPEEFRALYAYSPYHNLRPGTRYPAVLISTADRDDRVVPGHSFKYAARLQEVQAGDRPVLIRIETRAGHGGGTATDKAIELLADQFAFLAHHLGMPAGD